MSVQSPSYSKPLVQWLIPAVRLAGLVCLFCLSAYFTIKPATKLPVTEEGMRTGGRGSLPPANLAPSLTLTSSPSPFVNIVPSEDGREIYIDADFGGEVGGTLFASIGIGPGHKRGGRTMAYSSTKQIYVTSIAGFDPKVGTSGPLSITSTLGLDTGVVEFTRAYVPKDNLQDISSVDGALRLSLVNTGTLPSEAYIAVVPGYIPPGPPPRDHQWVGSAYSVRASGAVSLADQPMILRLYYNDLARKGANPHTLAIFVWDASGKAWDELNSSLFSDQQFVSAAVDRFTAYALLAKPIWRDDFEEFSGLDFSLTSSNIIFGQSGGETALVLEAGPGSGVAVTKPISPTQFLQWNLIEFDADLPSPATDLTVDVLSLAGTPLITNVASGGNLASLIDPVEHPSLRLRANLSSTTTAETPALRAWQLSWQTRAAPAEPTSVFLPLLVKN